MRRHQSGVALALVVWFIAGMSLLVAGIVSHARVDAGMTQLHLARAKTIAAGDGAIALAMLERLNEGSSAASQSAASQSAHMLGSIGVRVQLMPANGLVDLNTAPKEILMGLFVLGGAVDVGQAQIVADNVVQWRQPKTGARMGRGSSINRFYAPEDVLRVDGMTRSLLDSIRDYVVVGPWASGGIDWNASPEAVMGLLEQVNPERANTVRQRRDAQSRTSGLKRGQSSGRNRGPTAFRADALVEYGGRTWLRRRWVSVVSGANSSLPWRVVRTEAPRVVAQGMRESE
ncbi:general secretion pathway protein GspK [Halioglobus maricola]|uniref:General secretion pathway protein GspK n=1 Tax=Halioglobus maricola TaxID=2601894 RepID=A0A5P9NMG9_9GAMM|nr:type II secretion system protein GspK [Halioglobus maricola]QFU76706.1 general secretion pathway protein GspK [Halioglobus maricola]